jgi:hypothetical protein
LAIAYLHTSTTHPESPRASLVLVLILALLSSDVLVIWLLAFIFQNIDLLWKLNRD